MVKETVQSLKAENDKLKEKVDTVFGELNCDMNAVCNNTEGSHICTCKPGYTGDGSNCTGNNMFLFFVSSYIRQKYTLGLIL